ncbi:hypothetical protein BCAR13_520160 [Paraburkholderia caribensis]|nr:hypothetical protein BCAR13_520160 [Paraburkholderia caribensis]
MAPDTDIHPCDLSRYGIGPMQIRPLIYPHRNNYSPKHRSSVHISPFITSLGETPWLTCSLQSKSALLCFHIESCLRL